MSVFAILDGSTVRCLCECVRTTFRFCQKSVSVSSDDLDLAVVSAMAVAVAAEDSKGILISK